MSTKNAEPGFDCPMIYWIENGNDFFARWRSEAGVLPPKRVQVVNDTLTADAAYRLGCEGTALLWRGDFQNARQLLQAMARRLERKVRKAVDDPVQAFNLQRMAQAHDIEQVPARAAVLPFAPIRLI